MTGRVVGAVAVAVAALTAVGVGGYLAGRTATPAIPTLEQATAPTPADPAAPAVVETEAAVPNDGVAQDARPQPASASTPVERPTPVTATASESAKPAASIARTRPAARPTPSPVRPEAAPARVEPRPAPDPVPAVVARNEAPRSIPHEPVARPSAPEPPRTTASLPPVTTTDERGEAVERATPARRSEEFVVPSDSVIGLRLDDTISSETARVEQRVQAHVSRDLLVNGTLVIPAHARAEGQVTLVESGGKFRERARLGVRFHTLVLADGTSVPIQTDVIYREGQSVSARSAARIGGSAVGGAIIGAIFGGGKGAAIGAAAGAGAGTAATMATQKSVATLNAGSTVTVRLTNPTTVTVERDNN